ncbi:MAG: LPS export ABC transporter permease LptG [Burkholderiaceae bacterium]|jgi:lipopolysaccharide export system permease protein
MKVSIVQRYLAREILVDVIFVLIAFLGLFAFFDLVAELSEVGKNGYRIEQAAVIVLLGLPGRAYELVPIASLIGTIYALAQLASHSEFTILRVSGLSTNQAARMVLVPGVALVILTYILGELVTPRAETATQRFRAQIARGTMAQGFRSGLWVKDTGKSEAGAKVVRFVNIGEVKPDNSLSRVKIYEFDTALRLQSISFAAIGEYLPPAAWKLKDVVETHFLDTKKSGNPDQIAVTRQPEQVWSSELNPAILGVLLVSPEHMAALDLEHYIRHLEDNKQTANRYQIAFWKKIIYPFAVFVMMALALPFAYLHVRAGGISLKIFSGIMIGIGFYLLNSLFSHLGLLNTWPPILSAALPSATALLAALIALRFVDRT